MLQKQISTDIFACKKNTMKTILSILLLSLFFVACNSSEPTNDQSSEETTEAVDSSAEESLIYPNEKNFGKLSQLTFGGDNAEAYFSFDDKHLVFQATQPNWGANCDQIFYMPLEGYAGD